ncbi:LysR family transcriptional regulator [Xanthomonas sacchari]|uniref:LysR family transcriptional regulator n=1 Tax=Xanthomonas sacchari TaxID=56458 RepID=UPI00225756FA|nr:LysR family transcriptional regulator [Xanthomonas sacchari]MCW0403214.1 HTH-type transcriptional regulator CysL [Xanthomonas sacchari]MCW0414305.1 HTH-type transcriptional regulator CysL [Xanthomonas sacchari]MCW0422090.1 HTH-type transcriptional regulator CysL [Xanthomonas sacchari]MCW0435253.1 HTH-type transcriptional regulator CysL [Xanthomonas sacchari]MCW0456223.1 HTH-type transcriptional regulator CysL [Xanthomonas sacchari]
MKVSLRQLQIFCAVAEHGSTTGGGAAVALSQSATSAALNELESVLETRLFDRVGKRLLLNAEGERLLPQARQLLDGARQIETSYRPGASGRPVRLRIGCSTTIGNYVLPRLLADLRKSFPHIHVDADVANNAAIARKVADFQLDMGLLEGPSHLPELHAEPWLTDELLIVAGAQHPLAKASEVTKADLRRADWLLREQGSGTREEVEALLLRHLSDLANTQQIGSSEAIKNTLVQGIGVSCLSRWVVSDLLSSGRLVALEGVLPPLVRQFYLVKHRDKFFSQGLAGAWEQCLDIGRDPQKKIPKK